MSLANSNERTQKLSDIMELYSQNGCMFDCFTKNAESLCGCMPWNFLSFFRANASRAICNSGGQVCFWKNLYSGQELDDSTEMCPHCRYENCEGFHYHISKTATKLDSNRGFCCRHMKCFKAKKKEKIFLCSN